MEVKRRSTTYLHTLTGNWFTSAMALDTVHSNFKNVTEICTTEYFKKIIYAQKLA